MKPEIVKTFIPTQKIWKGISPPHSSAVSNEIVSISSIPDKGLFPSILSFNSFMPYELVFSQGNFKERHIYCSIKHILN